MRGTVREVIVCMVECPQEKQFEVERRVTIRFSTPSLSVEKEGARILQAREEFEIVECVLCFGFRC